MINKINVRTIPNEEQRYETCGDYWFEEGRVEIRVSDLGNEDMNFLVALHELVEAWLIKKKGVSEPEIVAFDIKHVDAEDPGSLPDAPYYKQHKIATAIEMLICMELGINWEDYDNAVNALFEVKNA